MSTVGTLARIYTKDTQGVTPSTTPSTTGTAAAGSDDFSTLLNGLLVPDQEKNVSEEELFAAMTVQRITDLKGADAGKAYQDLLQQTEKSMTTGGGYIPYETAARTALKKYRDAGSLTGAEADQVNAESFDAAQLDTNVNSLFDNIGSATDPTKAVASITDAIKKAQDELAKIKDGSVKVTAHALDAGFDSTGKTINNPYDLATVTTAGLGSGPVASGTIVPTGTKMDGADGFLFKPKSDHGGKLALLIPVSAEADALNVIIKDSAGNVIEKGRYWNGHTPEPGDPATMTRKKFDFSKTGAAYPKDITVEVQYSNGTVAQYKIPDPSKRYD